MKAISLFILLLVTACTSPEINPVAAPEPVAPVLPPAGTEAIIQEWLIGSFQSRWFAESTNITTITEESFAINLSDFSTVNQPYPTTYYLLLDNVATESDERHLTLFLDNGINITFRKNDDPTVSDITIEINERHFGWFKKL